MGNYEEESSGRTAVNGLAGASLGLNGLFPFRMIRSRREAPKNFSRHFQMLGELTALNGQKTGNFMYSPACLYSALQAAAYGAAGNTREEIIKLTGRKGYDLKSEAVNVWNFLVTNGKKGRETRIREKYAKLLETNHNLRATAYELTDGNCGWLVNEINSRCGRETNGQITRAVRPEDFQDISPMEPFTAFLGNVLHFKGTWLGKCSLRTDFNFFGRDGKKREMVAVDMRPDGLSYFSNQTVEAFCAPYKEDKGRYTFWGFLPKVAERCGVSRTNKSISIGGSSLKGADGSGDDWTNETVSVGSTFSGIEGSYGDHRSDEAFNAGSSLPGGAQGCDISQLDLSGLKEPEEDYKLYVEIPKFLFQCEMDMKEGLKRFGVNDAFDRQRADFTRGFSFPKDSNIYLNSVKQQTVIDFNEKGTEASAFTGIGLCTLRCMPREREIWLTFNRPFYFMIWDEEEKLPLFVGQVFEPSYEK